MIEFPQFRNAPAALKDAASVWAEHLTDGEHDGRLRLWIVREQIVGRLGSDIPLLGRVELDDSTETGPRVRTRWFVSCKHRDIEVCTTAFDEDGEASFSGVDGPYINRATNRYHGKDLAGLLDVAVGAKRDEIEAAAPRQIRIGRPASGPDGPEAFYLPSGA
jgi:hypothetical protein